MCLRELAFIAAINQFEIRAIHLGSNENRIADHLSRWNLSECHRQQFYELTSEYKLTECVVSDECSNLYIHGNLFLFQMRKYIL